MSFQTESNPNPRLVTAAFPKAQLCEFHSYFSILQIRHHSQDILLSYRRIHSCLLLSFSDARSCKVNHVLNDNAVGTVLQTFQNKHLCVFPQLSCENSEARGQGPSIILSFLTKPLLYLLCAHIRKVIFKWYFCRSREISHAMKGLQLFIFFLVLFLFLVSYLPFLLWLLRATISAQQQQSGSLGIL